MPSCSSFARTFFSTTTSSSSQPQSSPSIDPESQLVITPIVGPGNQSQILLEWKKIGMMFCCTSALEISVLFAQDKSPLSVSFYLFSLAILLTFLCLFVSSFIAHKFARTAEVLEKISALLFVTVVVFTITIPFPLTLKCVTWLLYVISLMVVLTCQYYCF